jgi:phosphoglucomutase
MQGLMDSLRASPPKEISGRKVVTMQDYLRGESYNPATGEKTGAIEQPSSNVLQFVFADGVLSVRPSGTEPKIKFYASLHGEAGEDLEPAKQRVKQGLADLETEVDGIIERAVGA